VLNSRVSVALYICTLPRS